MFGMFTGNGMISKAASIMKDGAPAIWDFFVNGIDDYISSVPLQEGETSISPVIAKDQDDKTILVIAAFNDFTVVRTVEIVTRENFEKFLDKIKK